MTLPLRYGAEIFIIISIITIIDFIVIIIIIIINFTLIAAIGRL